MKSTSNVGLRSVAIALSVDGGRGRALDGTGALERDFGDPPSVRCRCMASLPGRAARTH
jgi:hypothetical protein